MAPFVMPNQELPRYDWKKLSVELLVVFLGVTAGFVLNNWQLERKDHALEQQYLDGFLEDVGLDLEEIKKTVGADSLWLANAQPKLIGMRDGTLSEDSVSVVLGMIVQINRTTLQSGTYQDITNAGNLNLITDFDLRRHIVNYYIAIDEARFVDDYFYQFSSNFVLPFLFENVNLISADLDNAAVLKSPKFSNAVAGYFGLVQQRKDAYEQLGAKALALTLGLEKLN